MKTYLRSYALLLVCVSVASLTGCSAFRHIKGIPVECVPDENLALSREHRKTISQALLTQATPKEHIIDAGDVLGIYIEGVLGNAGESPPVNFPVSPEMPPTIGFPLQVRDDGTISMPLYGAPYVSGMTLRQLEEHLRDYYVNKKILTKGREKIIVTLQKPRQVRVLVLRQETQNAGGLTDILQGGALNLGAVKRGSGKLVYLPAYQNDVLHALAETGGLPGLDAENAIYIIRNPRRKGRVHPTINPAGGIQQYMPGNYPPGMAPHYSAPMYPEGMYPQGMPTSHLPLSHSQRKTSLSDPRILLAGHKTHERSPVQFINGQQIDPVTAYGFQPQGQGPNDTNLLDLNPNGNILPLPYYENNHAQLVQGNHINLWISSATLR